MHKAAMEMGKWAMEKAKACGYENLSSQDWDDLKDCMEAVKCAICADKDYRIVEAMDESEQEEKYLSRMGYDNYRYSNGRFVPKGRGTRMGYRPYLYMQDDDWMNEYLENPIFEANLSKMGYHPGNGIMEYGNDGRNQHSSRYGESYDDYRNARRHYTETKDPEHQRQMREKIGEVFDDMESITMDMVKDMSPEDKQKYKAKLQQMMQKIQ